MKNNQIILHITLVIIALSLALMAGLMVKTTLMTPAQAEPSKGVMTIDEVANYLDLSTGEVIDLIKTEEKMLQEVHVYSGLLFPYYQVNNNYFFVKTSVDTWLEDISKNRKQYDLDKKTAW